ncbi:ornithine cyclodeaminase [Variovorax boronicumulans]|uniref:Ornithine cyclodeaminase n=1 Tax=Variovorax boronicumulans TaxID=436515 RepID=A0AAW8DV03_9BURK|nr:ornithine cyclodeaminase family protein [Variovorax boronicumulans]MDP9878003.1 ornithine cyclodeaminase [Variovorax boronicumulans]MDP9923286.1 ornithine cyclodeaminase [Variovorax boronicumulans]
MMLLDAQALRTVLDLPGCIEAMRRVFIDTANGGFHAPLRSRVRPAGESPNGMTLMPSLRTTAPRRWCLKEMVVTPANAARGLDPLQGVVVLHDGEDGRVLAIADAPALTTLRTAATTALATRTFARSDARTVAVIGTGAQGGTHIAALRTILPFAHIRLWGRTPERAAALARSTGCEAMPSIEAAVRDADVVCTVTAAIDPFLRPEWLKPGCHVNAVGSSTPAACEIEPALMAKASLFVDRRDAALAESGDVRRALAAGAIGEDHIRAELGDVLCGRHPGRRSDSEITLYKSLGFGALDLAALELAIDNAQARGLGVQLEWSR